MCFGPVAKLWTMLTLEKPVAPLQLGLIHELRPVSPVRAQQLTASTLARQDAGAGRPAIWG